jgi:hypothetical protein
MNAALRLALWLAVMTVNAVGAGLNTGLRPTHEPAE